NSFSYTNGNVLVQTNELGLVTTNTWDALNRLVAVAYPDGTTTSNLYSKLDVVGIKDRLNNWTYFGFNSICQLVSTTNASGQVVQYDYCACGSPSHAIRWNGATALTNSFTFDMVGRITNATFADGYQLRYAYDD